MTKDDVIRMAREAGLTHGQHWNKGRMTTAFMRDFAALVAAAERDKYEVQFKKLMRLHEIRESQPNKPCCLAEREACAKVCEAKRIVKGGEVFAAAIRARGNT